MYMLPSTLVYTVFANFQMPFPTKKKRKNDVRNVHERSVLLERYGCAKLVSHIQNEGKSHHLQF
jgi:hypothetical protein